MSGLFVLYICFMAKINWRSEYKIMLKEWKSMNQLNLKYQKEKLVILKFLHDLSNSGQLVKMPLAQVKKFNRIIGLLNK